MYQKAYLEFFCSPILLKLLMDAMEEHPTLRYHAVDANGNTYTNTKSSCASAVTWGVFPNKEVQQPTVIDPQSFLVWKDEAFRLWIRQWATIYNDESKSHDLIYNIHDTFFLVNVVDNNFIDGDIFSIFSDIIDYVAGTAADSARDVASNSTLM